MYRVARKNSGTFHFHYLYCVHCLSQKDKAGSANSLGHSPSPRSRTLACSHTSARSHSLSFNGLHDMICTSCIINSYFVGISERFETEYSNPIFLTSSSLIGIAQPLKSKIVINCTVSTACDTRSADKV